MKMVIPLCYSVVLSLVFYGVQKRLASFQKHLIFISFHFDFMNLEIKIGISLCDSDILFLLKTKLS